MAESSTKRRRSVGSTGPVCVTGASGFIASYLVKLLLADGYDVVGTVRDVSNAKKTNHLTSLPFAAERLKLVNADLLIEGSFDAAVEGAVTVFHTASPFFFRGATEEMLTTAVKGTENVLGACKKTSSVKRVVLTSSTAATYGSMGKKPIDHVYTGEDWSDLEGLKAANQWYPASKTAAERVAWEIVKSQTAWDLVVMNPTLVLGPMIQPSLNTSSGVILGYLNGQFSKIPNKGGAFVDVRDVAQAHVEAMKREGAQGRYSMVGASMHMKDAVEHLRTAHSADATGPIPTELGSLPPAVYGAPPPHVTKFSSKKTETDLGIEFHSFADMVAETVKSLKQHGYLQKK